MGFIVDILSLFIKIIGIILNVLMVLYGFMLVLGGIFIVVFGLTPNPEGGSPCSRLTGIAALIMGFIYSFPIMAFTRRYWIFGYVIAALIATILALSNSMPRVFVLSILSCQLILAGIAFFKTYLKQ